MVKLSDLNEAERAEILEDARTEILGEPPVTLADLTEADREKVMAKARAEVAEATKTRTESIGTAVGRIEREQRERQRAREAAKPPEVKAKENSESRAAFLAESTARILGMAGRDDLADAVTTDEMIPRVELIEARERAAAKSYGPGTPEREISINEMTDRVLEMAGVDLTEADKPPEAADKPPEGARSSARQKGDFVAEATARILERAGK